MKFIMVFGDKGTAVINAAQIQHCTLSENIITVYFATDGNKLEIEYKEKIAANTGFFEIWDNLNPRSL